VADLRVLSSKPRGAARANQRTHWQWRGMDPF
jgi:hypothetical protein